MITEDIPAVIPKPKKCEMLDDSFCLTKESRVVFSDDQLAPQAELMREYVEAATGFSLATEKSATFSQNIVMKLEEGNDRVDCECYEIRITAAGVVLSAKSKAGIACGIQTLRQLLPVWTEEEKRSATKVALPGLEIVDSPRFRWRGMHVDVSRHFFSVEQVCEMIDLFALHRLNTLHLHLTDDQGWRIEIKKYPKLTEIGGKRDETIIGHHDDRPWKYDGKPYGGFFSQDDIREIVEFADKRGVTVVPEIDMPGHMQAAIAAYPELGNTDQSIRPRCHWGISQNILNPSENTVRMMRDILDEIMELFPGPFVHVGGDEALKHEWQESKKAQERMSELGLKNEEELQSWFIKQMDSHIRSRGKRLVGWDEILEGGLPEDAVVMNWRDLKHGIDALNMGNDVVIAYSQAVYFDHYQAENKREEPLAIGGLTTTAAVYAFDPIPQEVEEDKKHHVLGVQGQLWTEYIDSYEKLQYMAFPRCCALSEIAWNDPDDKNYMEFLGRLKAHRRRLASLGVTMHPLP